MKCPICGGPHNMTGHYSQTAIESPLVTTLVTTPKKPVKKVTTPVTTRKSSDAEIAKVKAWREKNRERYNASARERRRKLKYDSEEEGT